MTHLNTTGISAHGVSLDGVDMHRSAVFLSPQRGFVAHGLALSSAPGLAHADLARERERLLGRAQAQGLPRIVIGAISFYPQGKSFLYVPERVRRVERTDFHFAPPTVEQFPRVDRISGFSDIDAVAFRTNVSRAIASLKEGPLQKVVLSHSIDIEFEKPPETSVVLERLITKYPQAYVFSLPFGQDDGKGGILVGASPELLIERRGNRVTSNPLAGSAALADEAAVRALKDSRKDRNEHAITVREVAVGLQDFCRDLVVPSEPSVLTAGPIAHLSSFISGTLRDRDGSALDLALALHPTPAVAGVPRRDALALIRKLEPHDRGLYAGAVGWCCGQGDGEWAVTLRCAVSRNKTLRLFAGGGIVPGSVPEAEWQEVRTKLKTMLEVLNVGT